MNTFANTIVSAIEARVKTAASRCSGSVTVPSTEGRKRTKLGVVFDDAAELDAVWRDVVLSWLRTLCSHVLASPNAKGMLDEIASMVYAVSGEESLANKTSSFLVSPHYAPQRWLSHVSPLRDLCSRIGDVVLYLMGKKSDKQKMMRAWAS